MSETILQTYLNNQFIKTSDEGNIASLKKAVAEVVKRLEKKKEKIYFFFHNTSYNCISEYKKLYKIFYAIPTYLHNTFFISYYTK